MKKNLKILASLIFIAASAQAFAEMNLAFSFKGESGKFVCDDASETVNKQLYGLTALLVNNSDVAFRWYISGGTAQAASGDAYWNGGDFSLSFGIGKAFVRSEKILSTLTGCVGLDIVDMFRSIPDPTKEDGEKELNAFVGTFKMGFDFTTIFKCNKRLGFYTNLGFYYSIGGQEFDTGQRVRDGALITDEKKETSFYGFSLSPSIGLVLKLWD